jgi:class 3 adenylate cyclase
MEAVDAALTLISAVLEVLDPILESRGLPPLGIRIRIDSVEAVITTVGAPESKSHKDINGEKINLAAKIQTLPSETLSWWGRHAPELLTLDGENVWKLMPLHPVGIT